MQDSFPEDRPQDAAPGPGGPLLDRRGFVAAALSSAVALILQACGRTPPQPLPDPTRAASATALPASATATATRGASATASATANALATATEPGAVHLPLIVQSQPTATPTLSPTATPEPTVTEGPPPPPPPTATLAATPFPPGIATKLGLFVGYQHPTLETMLRTRNVPFVKTLEYDGALMEFIKQISPETLIVARYTPLDQLNLATINPEAEARRFVDLLLPIATEPRRLAAIDAWEAYNEPVAKTRDEMQRLAAFEAERTRLLAQAGVRSCVGNFATGTPDLELWPDFFPALRAVKETNGFLGLHEYSAPYMWFGSGPFQLQAGQDEGDEGWLTLRYRKVYRQFLQPNGLDVPLLITETGIDGGIPTRPGPVGLGWRDFEAFWKEEGRLRSSAAGFYVEQLAWYDAELAQDPYVKGASIYALAAPIGWTSFEILGQCADILLQYLSVHPRR